MRRLSPQSVHDEDGATAVVVAISLVVLFGMAAFAIDVGQLYQERRELQNGADAAVLAAAQDCADPATADDCIPVANPTGDETCYVMRPDLESRVREYADANANDGQSAACVVDLGADHITVETETLSGGNGFLTHFFAAIIGNPTSTVTARATARWAVLGGGGALPLTFSVCEYLDFAEKTSVDPEPIKYELKTPPTDQTIVFHTQTISDPLDPDYDGCNGPAGQDSPGGFGWLYPTTDEIDSCYAYVDGEGNVDGDTGANPECDPAYLRSLAENETPVLVPIFEELTGTGSNTVYNVIGFTGFVLKSYRLSGDPEFNYPSVASAPCNGAERCIRGSFTEFVGLADAPASPGSINLGAYSVMLTE